MTREEAIKIIESNCSSSGSKLREACAMFIPELVESEDERIRKWLIGYFEKINNEIVEKDRMRIIAYLEKQKADTNHNRMVPIYSIRDSFESALDKAWKFYNDSGSSTVDGCEENAIELAFAKGFREGFLAEKQKEQKDWTEELNTKIKELHKQCIATIAEQKEPIDPFDTKLFQDGVKEGRRLEREDMEKEQKPAEYLDKDKVYAIMTKLTNLSFSQRIPIHSDEYKKINEITSDIRGLLDYPIEQKPVEWGDNEKMFQLIEDVIRVYGKTQGEWISGVDMDTLVVFLRRLRNNKSAEWSEEDEKMLNRIITDVECQEIAENVTPSDAKERITWLKSLRPQPHWKPSSKEKGALRTAIHVLTEERNFPLVAEQLQNILNAFEGTESKVDWKPSEEQMKALKYFSLYDELKAL